MVDNEIFKKVSNLILLVLASLAISLCVRHTYAEEIPPLPDEAKNVLPLDRNFEPAIGEGIQYLQNGKMLQMSNSKQQCGAIWNKKLLDLACDFEMTFYLYLGNQEAEAGDGMTFCLQGYNQNYIGEKGQGLGAYEASHNKVLALEFDTFYNSPGADSTPTIPYRGTHHIAFCQSEPNWKQCQQHMGVANRPRMILSNGFWKKVVISGKRLDSRRVELSYKVRELTNTAKTREYANACDVDYLQMFGTSKVYWGFTSSTGANWETNALAFAEFPQSVKVTSREITIYQGEKWDPSQNFVSASDENGAPILWGDPRLTSTNNVKTDTPGTYEVTYNYKSVDGGYTQTATAKVTVLKDKTSLCTQDTTLYVGEKWNPETNFVSATDEAGNSVPWRDSRIDINGATVDTTQPELLI